MMRHKAIRAPFLLLWLWFIYYTLFYCNGIFAQKEISELQPPQLSYNASVSRDPFEDCFPKKAVGGKVAKEQEETSEETVQPLPSFTIQGIIYGGRLTQAIIDDAVVKIGDVIKEAEIIGIDKEGITLLYYGKKYKIPAPAYTPNSEIKLGGKK